MKSGVLLLPAYQERVAREFDRPEKAGGWNATVVVVELRARPGRE